MTKRTLFIASKSRLFATLATAGVMVGGVAGLEAQATDQVSAELKLSVTATELAQHAASINRFVHPAPTATANSAVAPTVSSQGTSTPAAQTAAPAAPVTNTVATPAAPAPAPPVAPPSGTSGGSK